jgi:hypothetical protein
MPMPGAPQATDENGVPTAGPSMPGGVDQLGQTLDASKGPTSVQVNTPTVLGRAAEIGSMGAYDPTGGADTTNSVPGHPTKFGMLMKVLAPALQGGLIGWAGGKGTPGGGFNAAGNYFAQQRQLQMQRQVMQMNAQKQYYENAKNAAETNYYQQGGGARFNQPVVGDNGNYWQINRATGRLEDTGVAAKDNSKAPPADKTTVSTDPTGRQVVINETKATAKPIVMEGSGDEGAAPAQTGLAPTQYNSGSARLPRRPSQSVTGTTVTPTMGDTGGAGLAPSAGLPLGSKFKPLPSGWRNQAEEDAAQEYRSKNPDASAADVLRYVSTLTREPKDNNMSPKEYRARQASLITQLNTGFREIENQRQQHIKSLGEFPDPNDLSQIETDTANAKQEMHQRMVDSANAEGIDIGSVPDYRAQLGGGSQGLPLAPPKGQRQNGGQPLDAATARKIFAEAGNDPVEARKLAKQRGYTIDNGQSSPPRPKGVPNAAVWNPDTGTWQLRKSNASNVDALVSKYGAK